mgnify:CR=1 FL=1
MDPEIFAAFCAVEIIGQSAQLNGGSWTTGSGTGSDPDD